MVFPLPKSVSSSMERLMRKFLWPGNQSMTKTNQVRWDVVYLPTMEGGLGIRRIHHQNDASFIRLGWSAASSSSLWADWMSCRYFPNSAIWSTITPNSGSCIWRKIRSLAHHVFSGSQWIIGNGQQVDIWYDSWADVGPMSSLFPLLQFPPTKKLSSLWEGNIWIISPEIPSNVPVTLWNSLQSNQSPAGHRR